MSLMIASTLTTCTCSKCGITFAAPQHFFDSRHKDHETFYCPNGHNQYFASKTREQRRIEQLEAKLVLQCRWRKEEERSRKCAERKVRKLAKEKERAQVRAAAGACPCCHRNFKRLRAHMLRKHPEFVKEADEKRCPRRKTKRRRQ